MPEDKSKQEQTATPARARRKRRVRSKFGPKPGDWRPALLEKLAESGSLVAACDAAKIGRVTVWQERQKNKQFAADYEIARQTGAQLYEEEARRRAVDGIRKIVLHGGMPVRVYINKQGQAIQGVHPDKHDASLGKFGVDWDYLYETQYSDRILELLLKRNFPSEYRERIDQRHSGAIATGPMTAEDLAEMRAELGLL